jgi:hypothetical protein
MEIVKSIYGYFGGGKSTQSEELKYTDQYFIDWLTNTNLLKPITKKNYLQHILTMKTDLFNENKSIYWIIFHSDEFKDALLEFSQHKKGRVYDHVPVTTLKAMTTVIISLILHHQDLQEHHPTILKEWKHLSEEIAEPLTEQIDSNTPNQRQEKAFISYEDLCKIRDQLENGSDARLLLSLYTMIEPIRSNFNRVRIYDNEPRGLPPDNYIILGKINKIIIQKYKTDEVYSPIINDLPDELVKQINSSLEKNPREWLFESSEDEPYDDPSSWNKWANRLMKKFLNNPYFSLTMFRHIYLSHFAPEIQKMNRAEKKKIALKMGHSIDQQSKYIFKEPEEKK